MKWILILLFVTAPAFAGKYEYCKKRQDPFYFQKLGQMLENRLSFTNDGGAFDVGVCWWHSRFQRAALYLTIYEPTAIRPSRKQAKKIIGDIQDRKRMVVIPGYRSFREFSLDHEDLIQDRLEQWQIGNTLLFRWISGLTGVTQNSAQNMEKRMRDLYEEVMAGNVVYQKLQLKGIDAHAWLVIGMQQTDEGYKLEVIDSNYSHVKSFYYNWGAPGIYHGPYGGFFVSYTEQKSELDRMKRIGLNYCR